MAGWRGAFAEIFTLGKYKTAADKANDKRKADEAAALAAEQAAAAAPPAPPPSTTLAASVATGEAKSAAERQRKRARAGGTLLSPGTPVGGPGASLQPRTLLGA